MMMMADGLLGSCSDQVIEGVTVKVDSDPETEDDGTQAPLSNGYPTADHNGSSQAHHHHPHHAQQEVVETVTHLFSSLSAACANCSISFFDPIGNPVYQPIFYMCLDSNTNEAIQISSVIHIVFAKKLARCPKPSSDLALCSKCAELIARMYQLYRELDGLSAVNAYINSFLGDTNTNEVYLPTPESSNTSINYAHYEDSISAAISGGSSFSTLPDVAMPPEHQQPNYDRSPAPREQKPLVSSEPPPLTYPSYFGSPRPNPFTSQQYNNNEHFILPDVSPLYHHPHVQVKVEPTPDTSYANLATHSRQEAPQSHPPPPPEKTGKKRKRKPGNQPPPEAQPPAPAPVPAAPLGPRSQRVIHCAEPGCDKVYHGRGATASLRTHIQIFHLKQFPFVCQVCLKPMKKRSLLDLHVKTHLGPEEREAEAAGGLLALPEVPPANPCPQCGKGYNTPYLLSIHVARHHTPEGEARLFPCEFRGCPKKFRDKSSLRRHELRHETPEFACSRCPQHFLNKNLLKAHQETCALDQRQFLCRADNCKRKFKYKHHLQNHYMFQHKLSAEEARKEVYPGLSVKEWMTPTRKRSPVAGRGGRPPDAAATSADQLPPFNTVLDPPPPFASGIRPIPESLGSGMYDGMPEMSSSHQPPNSYHQAPPPFHQTPEMQQGGSTAGYPFQAHHHHPPLEGQGVHVQQMSSSEVSFDELMPPLTSVIQETSSALQHHHHHHVNSFPNSSLTVIHPNPSVIQQNPIPLYHLHHNNRPPPPPPLSTDYLQNHGNSSGTTMAVNEVKIDLDLNE